MTAYRVMRRYCLPDSKVPLTHLVDRIAEEAAAQYRSNGECRMHINLLEAYNQVTNSLVTLADTKVFTVTGAATASGLKDAQKKAIAAFDNFSKAIPQDLRRKLPSRWMMIAALDDMCAHMDLPIHLHKLVHRRLLNDMERKSGSLPPPQGAFTADYFLRNRDAAKNNSRSF